MTGMRPDPVEDNRPEPDPNDDTLVLAFAIGSAPAQVFRLGGEAGLPDARANESDPGAASA